jgi:hypothetical protein
VVVRPENGTNDPRVKVGSNGLNGAATVIDLKLTLDGDGFFDGRNGVGIEPPRNSEKHLRFRHFAGDFHCALVRAVYGTADYEAVFENLVLPRRRVTLLQEAVVVVERHLDHFHWPMLFLPARKLSAD